MGCSIDTPTSSKISRWHACSADSPASTNPASVEYIPSSQRGIIRVYRCAQCRHSYYKFSSPPIIKKQGKQISFNEFLKGYWKAKFPTLILDKQSLNVSKVVY